ncbi:MAG TPA: hypothetical protein VN829_09745 [Dongiaceae bacterium]|nr:hypothetical protein [Dongiaceae bacterium]
MTRREFLKQAGVVVAGATAGAAALQPATGSGSVQAPALASAAVAIVVDPADPVANAGPARWALEQLREALVQRQINVQTAGRTQDLPPASHCVLVAGAEHPLAREILTRASVSLPSVPESLAIASGRAGGRSALLACGHDPRGLTYALLELADRVRYAGKPLQALRPGRPVAERPASPIRSIMRLFASEVEDQGWFYDRAFWQRYLSMLAAERFNRFSLALGLGYDFTAGIRDAYFHFAYPFLVAVPGYDVRVSGLSAAERGRNLELLRFISDETAARGLHFQLGLWTHAYKWTNSPQANHVIEGLTPESHAPYCRDALRAVLTACPAIQGVTFRVHGESGVAEGNYAFWRTVFEGLTQCGRRVELDMHAKGMDAEMIEVALATGLPVNISPKFWAEHMGLPYHQAGIRPTEMPPRGRQDEGFFAKSSGSRSFLRYGYGDLLAEGRRYGVLHRIWPGTQRLLLWGDPALAAGYGRAASFCGSVGVELFEPLSFKGRKGSGLPGGREAYADASLKPASGDFDKYAYGYRLWGRLLYDPDAAPEAWRRQLDSQYGRAVRAASTIIIGPRSTPTSPWWTRTESTRTAIRRARNASAPSARWIPSSFRVWMTLPANCSKATSTPSTHRWKWPTGCWPWRTPPRGRWRELRRWPPTPRTRPFDGWRRMSPSKSAWDAFSPKSSAPACSLPCTSGPGTAGRCRRPRPPTTAPARLGHNWPDKPPAFTSPTSPSASRRTSAVTGRTACRPSTRTSPIWSGGSSLRQIPPRPRPTTKESSIGPSASRSANQNGLPFQQSIRRH